MIFEARKAGAHFFALTRQLIKALALSIKLGDQVIALFRVRVAAHETIPM